MRRLLLQLRLKQLLLLLNRQQRGKREKRVQRSRPRIASLYDLCLLRMKVWWCYMLPRIVENKQSSAVL